MDKDNVADRPYGQACANCSQNKSKCTPREEDGECERSVNLLAIEVYLVWLD